MKTDICQKSTKLFKAQNIGESHQVSFIFMLWRREDYDVAFSRERSHKPIHIQAKYLCPKWTAALIVYPSKTARNPERVCEIIKLVGIFLKEAWLVNNYQVACTAQ